MRIQYLLLFLLIGSSAFSQTLPSPQDSSDRALYIDSTFFHPKGLMKGEENRLLTVWNSESRENPGPARIVDIRWVFDSPKDAKKWLKANLREQSEGGDPYKLKSKLKGVKNLNCFRENPKMAQFMAAMGVSQNYHYFIFTVDNVVVKIFVSTDTGTRTEEVMDIPREAIRRVNEALGK